MFKGVSKDLIRARPRARDADLHRYVSRTGKYTARGYGRRPPEAAVVQMFARQPVGLLSRLIEFSGPAVVLAALLQRQVDLLGWPVVRLPVGLLNLCRLNRVAVSRALMQLEAAGLVRVHRRPGRRSTVTVLWNAR